MTLHEEPWLSGGGEPFLPFPAPPSSLGSASAARSTLVTVSLHSLRARGLQRRYEALLRPEHAETLLTAVAGTWLPIDVALAHYEACDALALHPDEQLSIAMEVGDRLNGTFLGTVLRLARSAGVTPWQGLAHSMRLYDRLFCGGGLAVSKLGPKEARVELVGNPLHAIAYFRVGVCGVFQCGLQRFCRRVYIRELPARRPGQTMTLRISWA